MKVITIKIPGMQSQHCQTRVKKTVEEIEGAQIQTQEPGKITVFIASDPIKSKVIDAIENAGYPTFYEEKNN